ncbi:MAG TPA: molybdopterin cofactor-binding domain-containing protein [Bacteriovoracaceae bacterium]|nr:molybdopterin cofactor-binding domain-containing protein [Bacteriovoracaceae bacterium]
MSVGKTVQHDSGLSHVTGESIFIDDRPEVKGEIHVGVVGSPTACGEVIKIHMEKALAHPDCLGVFTARDFVGHKWGAIIHDQPFLADPQISYMHEPVCLIASAKRESVAEIKSLITIDVRESDPVFTISAAKIKNSILYKAATPFVQGDVEAAFASAPHILEGVFKVDGQEHFYLESQAAIAYPLENGQMEVHSSSQHPSETQRVVAEALGLPLHHVVCVVKRMGGGFGGKESQAAPIAAYAALVASKLGRAARLIFTKDEDMMITGKRHPFENEYKVAFDDSGKILALKATLQSDGGAYSDLSSSILERAMFHLDAAYYLENVYIDAVCYRTNNHSNTAYRGFGGPQGTMTIESIIEEMAHFLKLDAISIRKMNLYRAENNRTPYGQVLENNMLPELFEKLYLSSDYANRLKEIKAHNQKRTGTLRGISLTTTKFGIAFTARFLNQGNALVNLHLDGTFQVSTGATEMGQGVNTKIQQIVADALGVPPKNVQVMPTSTEKNHNTSPTAASSGADINGAAALAAANIIKGRITELAKQFWNGQTSDSIKEYEITNGALDPDVEFKDGRVIQSSTGKEKFLVELISLAYFNRISLGAYAFYKTPGLGFDKVKVEGKAFNYFTQGMAVSEVSIDEYTGDVKILRTDILMDLGRMINPGIDRGQVIGAFIQGVGWVTTEKLFYDSKRHLLSHSPTTYKIPSVQDVPRDLRVDFIENPHNTVSVYGSKAVGEPPFLLGSSVWTAVKHALTFRAPGKRIELTSPATNEVVLMELNRLR